MRGKPYHISALYVVDLEKFRKDRVGDILRSQYHALSADPGSLANLDQDLPNYAQHQVPIFSLPQEWLWCESWCSNETKADSKTIDLCNNPLHKEPKVSMAKVRTTIPAIVLRKNIFSFIRKERVSTLFSLVKFQKFKTLSINNRESSAVTCSRRVG